MKFSNTLEFNAVREWSTHYVHYARLKHLVREIGLDYAKAWQQERAAETTGVSTSDEESRLVEAAAPLLEQRTRDFLAELDRELAAVNEFYRGKETEFADEVRALQEMAGELVIVPLVSVHGGAAASSTTAGNASGTRPAPTVADSSSATASVVEMSDREPLIDHRQDSTAFEDQDHFAHRRNTASATLSAVHTSPSPPPVTNSRLAATSFDAGTLSPMSPPLLARVGSNDYARRLAFHAKAKDVYVNLCSLKEYVVLNYTAFAKILKKFDKMLGTNVRESYLPIVESSYFWVGWDNGRTDAAART